MESLRAYPNNRLVMRPSENLSAYGGVRGQGGRPKMLGGGEKQKCRGMRLRAKHFSWQSDGRP